jgi:hypothetical protein
MAGLPSSRRSPWLPPAMARSIQIFPCFETPQF